MLLLEAIFWIKTSEAFIRHFTDNEIVPVGQSNGPSQVVSEGFDYHKMANVNCSYNTCNLRNALDTRIRGFRDL